MTTQTTEDIEREAELEIQGWIDWNRAQRKKKRRAAHAMNRDRQRKEPSDRAQWRRMPATAEQLDALRRLASETGVTFTAEISRGVAWRRIRSATSLLSETKRRACAPPWALAELTRGAAAKRG